MSDDEQEFFFDIRLKKKFFENKDDHLQQLEQKYIIKHKTELCHNFTILGKCKFKENCSFAHGIDELQGKKVIDNFKTKPCKNYFKNGVCVYGQRCQYMHEEVKFEMKWWGYMKKYYKKQGLYYTFPWDKGNLPNNYQQLRIDMIRFIRINDTYQILDQGDFVILKDFLRMEAIKKFS